jgi:hypothetical protein
MIPAFHVSTKKKKKKNRLKYAKTNKKSFLVVPPNKQKSLFNKYCHDLGEKMKNEKKNKKVKKGINKIK